MKAIVVKYLPATNTKPSRVKASVEGLPAKTIGYHSADGCPYREAATQLAKELEWSGRLVEGDIQSGVKVFVFMGTDITNVIDIDASDNA